MRIAQHFAPGIRDEVPVFTSENVQIKLNELLVKHTGQPLDRIKQDTERDYFMSAIEAKEYGLIDDVLIQKLTSSAPGK